MIRALLDGRGDVIYGSRYLGRGRHDNQSLPPISADAA